MDQGMNTGGSGGVAVSICVWNGWESVEVKIGKCQIATGL